ncbi:Hsp70 family protein [Vibrio zhugei]|uniref:Hsp70 family protein n=3 Tax=Vibrio TaxID=662 RepID=A0ABV7C446_9VIBR|nr:MULTISPECIES: Hsp70 family protein [Vibrio]EKO3570177.1 Hsp70 family protein [Vibrio metschnikovii]EKO3967012.1 Hsp70 family protein [Vibrio fluvialis]HBC3534545.1 Hsp70 family protein [Vibrio vulnificus]EGQ7799879.1 Hsp70 family protein [Vibrio parahaemolyticus]EKO3577764.1 Hsp70 family protein [Vibrio metschnikovii]
MKHFIGIDLGTTNSAISSFDGVNTRVWKSPIQTDVTPSAIYIDRRGRKLVGQSAYEQAARSPDNAAVLFKRLMGTSSTLQFKAVGESKTPVECSSEVLKTLFGYLTEEIRENKDTGVVITVPAAFNQMQKDATMEAASLAGFNNVALMQEPVAAVMSVMKNNASDGVFLIYDLGGGTLDIAIAESHAGKVNLLSHGGIAMCGGRDFDREILDNIVRPWLRENFELPDDFVTNPNYKTLIRMANHAVERAKIELSSREESIISLTETEARTQDLSGEEIYIDIELTREMFNKLIDKRVNASIDAAREALSQAHLTPDYINKVAFVGGPTNYKPLRDKVCFELGIEGDNSINPMTAVAEGASIFAESIDWDSQDRSRKSSRGKLSLEGNVNLSFNFHARTPKNIARVLVQLSDAHTQDELEFQVDCINTGWTSGLLKLKHGAALNLPLNQMGENSFKVFVFNNQGQSVDIGQDVITITKTAASVEAIPASHTISIEALNQLGGSSGLVPLVKAGDTLPVKGRANFKAAESLRAGAISSINIKLWEGDIKEPISDNRPIGVLKISGTDFEQGVIPAGADIECEYEILDSGAIKLEVSVPSIGSVFDSGKNFYSRQEGQVDYSSSLELVKSEGESLLARIEALEGVIDSEMLQNAKNKAVVAANLDANTQQAEDTQEAMEQIYEAKKLLSKTRDANLAQIRQIEVDDLESFYTDYLYELASESDRSLINRLFSSARNALSSRNGDFENIVEEIRGKNFQILWNQDWFVVEKFKSMATSAHLFSDRSMFDRLVNEGVNRLENDDIDGVKEIILHLSQIQIGMISDNEILANANIVMG